MQYNYKRTYLLITILYCHFNISAQNWSNDSWNYTLSNLAVGSKTTKVSGSGHGRLLVGNGQGSESLVINAGSDGNSNITFSNDYNLEARLMYNNGMHKLEFWRLGKGYQLSLTEEGSLGIGIRTPSSKLEINGGLLLHKGSGGFINLGANQRSDYISKTDGAFIYSGSDDNDIMLSGSLILQSSSKENRDILFVTGRYPKERVKISSNGNVGIGTSNPDELLAVNGTIHSKEVRVDVDNWPDYIFDEHFDLPSLGQIENYINVNGHLENIPSEKEVIEKGINVGEMNRLLLEKIEILTLHLIRQNQEIEKLKSNKLYRTIK